MKKIFSIILVLLLSLGMFAGCGSDNDSANQDAAVNSIGSNNSVDLGNGDIQFSKDTVSFVDANGKSAYRIIRPADNDAMFAIAGDMYKAMKENLKGLANVDDSSDGSDAYEILIGGTNRPESKFAYDYLVQNFGGRFDDYIVCTIGKKIVINGLSNSAVANAATYFLQNFTKSMTIEGGIMHAHKTEGTFTDITINGENISKFSIIRPHFNVSYLTQMEIDKIYDYVKNTTGFEVEVYDDADFQESEYEIIVGEANRNGVEKIDKNDTDTYSIKVSGKKVYINGGSTYATALGVTEFCKMLKTGTVTDANSVASGSYSTTVASYDKATYYTPTWLEDFKSTELDTTKWMHVPWSADGQNGKKSRRSEETYTFDGEYFTITPYQTDTEYHGGMIRTHRDMAYIYGYVEESAKIPTAKGFWTALWTGDTTGFGMFGDEEAAKEQILGNEIDINENFGANYVAANCHSWPTTLGESLGYKHTSCDGNEFSNDKKYYPDQGVDLHDDFHTYGLLWTPEYMSFTCDGRVYFTYDTTATEQDILTFNQKMYLTLSMAVGLKSGSTSISLATEDDWANRSTLVVDYVHLYQFQDGKSVLDLRENTFG